MKQILRDEIKNKLQCIQHGCDQNGTIGEQVGEDDWEAVQCEFCYKIRFPFFEELEKEISQLESKAVEMERERIKNFILDEIDVFVEAKDNDGHRYQIPDSKQQDWDEFLEIPEDDERSWDVPEWAERIDGMPIKQHGLNKLIEALQKKDK